jgi:ferrochelatase
MGGRTAVVLVAHGTVDALDDLPEFLTNIRRGQAPPPDLVAEVRRRYEAIGGRSPLNAINRELADQLGRRLGVFVRFANRLFHPYPKEVLGDLARSGVRRIVVVPLAQHSASVYGEAVKEAAKEVAGIDDVWCAENWGRIPELTRAYADAVAETLARVPPGEEAKTALVFTAHSLPVSVIEAGDPYEREVRGSAEDIVAELERRGERSFSEHLVAFQSQGMSKGPGGRPIAWLGPDLKQALEALASRGRRHVVFAPIGFLADHVEILYDLDIEARAWAEELGILSHRTASLNATEPLVAALAAVVARGAGQGG